MENEVQQLFARWLEKTKTILIREQHKRKVGITKDLEKSMETHLRSMGEAYLEGRLEFMVRGRFVDMGAGRKRIHARKPAIGRKRQKVRKPKPWYSPAFYGRLNDLQGAIGIQIMEQALAAIQNLKLSDNG